MFLQRALVSFTLGPLALYVVYLGGWFYFVPITAVLLLATIEYAALVERLGIQMVRWALVTAVFALLLAAQIAPSPLFSLTLVAVLAIVMFLALLAYERQNGRSAPAQQKAPIQQWMAMCTGVILLGWVGSHFLQLRNLPTMAWQWTMLALLSTWFTDSAAYLVGRFMAGKILLGRHQLSPRLSPNKTVEGYFGGVFLGTLITLALARVLQLPLAEAMLLGLLISILSPIGDLGISLLKREAGVKDSSRIFGEHGGALDRIDSLLWSVTMAYYLALFFV